MKTKTYRKLTKAQRYIILLFIIDVIAFLVLIDKIYLPANRGIKLLRDELEKMDEEVVGLKNIMRAAPGALSTEQGNGGNPQAWESQFTDLYKKFPPQEDTTLKSLQELARTHNLSILSVRLREKVPCYGRQNNKLTIEGKTCQEVGFTLEMRGRYEDVLNYMKRIKEDVAAYISFDAMEAKVMNNTDHTLKVALTLTVYLLS